MIPALLIIETISRFFVSVDNQDWDQSLSLMADQVLLDYSSMTQADPATLSSQDIIASWKAFLPGFDHTHHQLGNQIVSIIDEQTAHYFAYITASHAINDEGEPWLVVGSYDITAIKQNEHWVISTLKLNFKYQSGNLDLPALAQKRVGA